MSKVDFGGSNTPVDIRDLWQTPANIYLNLRDEFYFTGDLAASDINHLHDNYLTEEDDSLSVNWETHFPSGYKWCNPPYSDIRPWIDKAAQHGEVVMLIPADVSVGWFNEALKTVSEVRLITGGRISFVRADTHEPQNGNNKGSMLLIWRPKGHIRTGVKFTTVDRNTLMHREIEKEGE